MRPASRAKAVEHSIRPSAIAASQSSCAQHQPREIGEAEPQVAPAHMLRFGNHAAEAEFQPIFPAVDHEPQIAGTRQAASPARRSNSPASRRSNSNGSNSRIMQTSPWSGVCVEPEPPASSKILNSGCDGGACNNTQ